MVVVPKRKLMTELVAGQGWNSVGLYLTSETGCETEAEIAGVVVLGHYMYVAYRAQKDLARKEVAGTGVACILAFVAVVST